MAAATTDKLTKVGKAGNATTLSAPGHAIGGTSITVGSTTNWPTDTGVVFAIDRVTLSGTTEVQVSGSYTLWSGVVTSATTIGSMVLLSDSPNSDQVYAAGSTTRVYIPVSAGRENRVVDALLAAGINQDSTMTPVVKTSINDVNGNEVIKTPATTSAVNEITVTNATTGNAPSISATGGDSAVHLNLRGKGLAKTVTIGAGATTIYPFDYVASGCVWTADAAGSTRLASMTAGVVVINGNPITVAAVTGRTFTASKDVYVDVLDNGDGTGLLVYTDNTTNATSPALAANSIRIAIIVTGATSIAAAGSINQGQEDRVLPIASSIPYQVTDSLGNLICPRDPQRKILGYRARVGANFTTAATSATQITELSCPVIVPTGRKVRVTIGADSISNTTISTFAVATIWEGTVGSGTQLAKIDSFQATANQNMPLFGGALRTPSTASITYNGGLHASANTATLTTGATNPAFIMVELV